MRFRVISYSMGQCGTRRGEERKRIKGAREMLGPLRRFIKGKTIRRMAPSIVWVDISSGKTSLSVRRRFRDHIDPSTRDHFTDGRPIECRTAKKA